VGFSVSISAKHFRHRITPLRLITCWRNFVDQSLSLSSDLMMLACR
jgi:hypothetical protein